MILHRDATNELRAFKIAQIFDQFGLKIVAINTDKYGYWHVWGQGSAVNTSAVDAAIDPPEQEATNDRTN